MHVSYWYMSLLRMRGILFPYISWTTFDGAQICCGVIDPCKTQCTCHIVTHIDRCRYCACAEHYCLISHELLNQSSQNLLCGVNGPCRTQCMCHIDTCLFLRMRGILFPYISWTIHSMELKFAMWGNWPLQNTMHVSYCTHIDTCRYCACAEHYCLISHELFSRWSSSLLCGVTDSFKTQCTCHIDTCGYCACAEHYCLISHELFSRPSSNLLCEATDPYKTQCACHIDACQYCACAEHYCLISHELFSR